ncbi:MAG: ABC transporter permease [Candidatus Odinarchaeia archaeon]
MSATNITPQLRKAWAIAKKNMRIYYLKGPVIIFGLLFPLFFFFAFTIGRNMPATTLVPALIGMSAFFSASAVTPVITSWETRMKVLERFFSTPTSTWAIVLGDLTAAYIFGVVITIFPLIISAVLLNGAINLILITAGILISTLTFATIGETISVIASTDNPSTAMMIATLVKFPLLFISGVFVPLTQLPQAAVIISYISPLTYFVDIINYSITQISYFPVIIDFTVIIIITIVLISITVILYKKNMSKLI